MRKISMLLLAAVVVVVTACSSTSDTASGEKPGGVIADSYVVKATVQSINYKTRMATFKTDDGIVFSKRIEDDVKKIQQIKKGDVITARYIESIAVEVRKPDEAKRAPPRPRTVMWMSMRPARSPTRPRCRCPR